MLEHLQTSDGRLRVWDTFRDMTPGELFSYWVEPAKLKRWWPTEAVLDPVPGGHYRYELAADQTLTGTFLEVNPSKRLVFSWRDGQGVGKEQHVVADFERRDDDALLTVTQGPYGSGEAGERERQVQLESWSHVLGRLRTVLGEI